MLLDGGVGEDRDSSVTWSIVLPVKGLDAAKSRMGHVAGGTPGALALAFFQDTLGAAAACPAVLEVIVTTSDPSIARWAEDRGAVVLSDEAYPGINAAARQAALAARSEVGIAVLVSDLPCLTPAALAEALDRADAHARSYLADASGSGTTMLFGHRGVDIDPRFGPESASAHRASGAVDIAAHGPGSSASLAGARRDVDTRADLVAALALGVGPHTAAAVRGSLGSPP